MPPVDSLEELIDLLADHGAELTDPLVAACGIGNTRAVAKLLDLGAKIEGNGRWSSLEEALSFGQEAVVSLLLNRVRSPTIFAQPRGWEIWRKSLVILMHRAL